MTTGDVKNNLRKLKNVLKAIKYDAADNLDVASLTEGNASVYLPIYHYAFTLYSPKVAEFILSRNFELYGKTDARFMEVIYKILRDVFSYNSPVSKDRFFMKGFVERKLIMCTEIIQMVKSKHLELNPGPSKTAMKTSVRPKSAPENRASSDPKVYSSAVPKTKSTHSARRSPRNEVSPRQSTQVVNELVSLPECPPVRHTATVYDQRNVTRHIAGRTENKGAELPKEVGTTPEFITKRSASNTCENASQLGLKTTMVDVSENRSGDDGLVFGQKQTLVYPETPAIKSHHPTRVEIVSVPKRTDGYMPDVSILDIQASSTNVSMIQDSALDTQQMKEMFKNVEDLATDMKRQFNAAVATMQSQQVQTNPYVVGLEAKIEQQLENLRAQVVLLDNRLQIVETKLENNNVSSKEFQPARHQRVTINDQGSSVISQQMFLSDPRVKNLEQTPVDISLNYSPIRKVINGAVGEMYTANEDTFMSPNTEVDSRRSSTPTHGVMNSKTEPSFLGAASRIEQMFQETTKMIKDKPEIPSLRNGVD